MKNNNASPMKGEILKRKKDQDWVQNISSNVIRRDKRETRNKRMVGASLVLFLGLSVYAGFWFQDADLDPRDHDLLSIGVFEELENALDK
ncbi:hypothetical protein EHQ05_10265 [Leptospira yasudae]|uniref:Uncharacterized protein n=1 Tax=Leptospira yasudae TaxID=2202201 RepID=A0ABX9LZH6_9LEPT|nr:hypothetical protein [Leptospira yasudae]RHX77647.1 hypothetical protein DLM77_20580 [Leptospira yasudae]TGK26152.1 hypothetical protein EHQ05_10265 [Leptospira yasudae]TGM08601.1 hypothetical protein EHQ86_03285 [Leptospira yasudae]